MITTMTENDEFSRKLFLQVPVESVTAEKCPFQETRNVGSCTYKVLVQAWKNNLTELKDPDCELYTLTPGE